MAESPYQKWLHLPTDNPTHYQLLGLHTGESNLDVIAAAAAHVRRVVCNARPAPEEVTQWSALLSELERAETVLTDPAARVAYDQTLGIQAEPQAPMATPVNAPPPPPAPVQPPTATMGTPTGTVYQQPASYGPSAPIPDPMAPVAKPLATVQPAAKAAAPGLKPNATRLARKQRKRKQAERSLPVYLTIGATGMAILAGVVVALQGSRDNQQVAQAPTNDAAEVSKQPEKPSAPVAAKADSPPKPRPKRERLAASDVAVAGPDNATEAAKPAGPRDSSAAAVGMGTADPGMTEAASDSEPTDVPAPPDDPTPKPSPTPPAPEPVPSTPAEPAMAAVTPAEVAAMDKRLTEARNALSMGEIDRAQQLAAASPPGNAKQLEQWKRLQRATDLIAQFHEGLDRALGELQALSEIDIGPTKVAVVELRSDEIVIRASGQNRTYSLKQMPWALALGLTKNILPDAEPENKVVKAMYLAVHHQRNAELAEQAHELLQEAIAAGANVESLVAFIDDRYGEATPATPATPPPAPAPAPAPATPEQAQAMQKLLDKVTEDFGKNNLEAAGKRLAAAEEMPATAAQKVSLARLSKAAARLTSFHEALQEATDALKPDDEISITSSVTAKVLEVTQAKLRIQLGEDVLHTIDRQQMPAALAVELAKRELGESGATQVSTAVFVLFHPSATKKYKEQARGWLQDSGQDSDLLPLFDAL